MAYLVLQVKNQETRRLILKTPITLGRSLKCDVWLDDPALSREHCRFEPEGSGWYIVDLKSRNGTYVGALAVTRHKLFDGDQIRAGDARLEFREGMPRSERAADPAEDQMHREFQNIGSDTQTKSEPMPASRISPKPVAPSPNQDQAGATEADLEKWQNEPLNIPFQRPRATPIVRPKAPTPPPTPNPKPPQA